MIGALIGDPLGHFGVGRRRVRLVGRRSRSGTSCNSTVGSVAAEATSTSGKRSRFRVSTTRPACTIRDAIGVGADPAIGHDPALILIERQITIDPARDAAAGAARMYPVRTAWQVRPGAMQVRPGRPAAGSVRTDPRGARCLHVIAPFQSTGDTCRAISPTRPAPSASHSPSPI